METLSALNGKLYRGIVKGIGKVSSSAGKRFIQTRSGNERHIR